MARAHRRDPQGQFALNQRTYLPVWPVSDGSYKVPNVERPAVNEKGDGGLKPS